MFNWYDRVKIASSANKLVTWFERYPQNFWKWYSKKDIDYHQKMPDGVYIFPVVHGYSVALMTGSHRDISNDVIITANEPTHMRAKMNALTRLQHFAKIFTSDIHPELVDASL